MKTALLIMAAGLGSRYGGDKQVDRLGPDGEILMQYSVFDAIRSGFDKLVFVIKPAYRELLESICGAYRKNGVEVCFVYQDFASLPSEYSVPEDRVKPFGTVHAVLCAREVINEPFAVINADDFYGRDAFSVMHRSLLTLSHGRCSMVAYDLKNTVSQSGSVTRGICSVAAGRLSDITETYGIAVRDGSIFDESSKKLDGMLPVSMNMWGFHNGIFDDLSREFSKFLFSIPKGDIKAEYVLPSFIDQMVKQGRLSVDVLRTCSQWFGVTYKADRDSVCDRLSEMHASGEYPKKLIF